MNYEKKMLNQLQSESYFSPVIEEYSDPEDIKEINLYIERRKEERIQQKLESLEKSEDKKIEGYLNSWDVAGKYNAGDRSVVPEMIEILQGDNMKERHGLIASLEPSYYENTKKITEEELIDQLYQNLSLKEDENSLFRLLSRCNLRGYEEALLNHLNSGKANNIPELLRILSREGKNEEGFKFLESFILKGDYASEKYKDTANDIIYALNNYFKKGDPTFKEKAITLSLFLLEANFIPEEKFLKMKNSRSFGNPAEVVSDMFFSTADRRVIPLAEKLYFEDIYVGKALKALVRIEGIKYRNEVYKLLSDQKTFFSALEATLELYKYTREEEVLWYLIKGLSLKGESYHYYINDVIRILVEVQGEFILTKLEEIIDDKIIINELRQKFILANGSVEKVALDLFKYGVIDSPLSDQVIQKAKTNNYNDELDGYVLNLLYESGIYHGFHIKSGTMPVNYDTLIHDLAKNSNGQLNDISIWMDYYEVEDDNDYTYRVYVTTNNKIYTVSPFGNKSYYDNRLILNFMNYLLKDRNSNYRFVEYGEEYSRCYCGPIENLHNFLKDYSLLK